MKDLIIIGVVGYPASGKDTVADYIASLGFTNISSGDFIREEMKKEGMETDRTNMIDFVSVMREKLGDGYPTTEIVKKIKGNTVISGFRNTEDERKVS